MVFLSQPTKYKIVSVKYREQRKMKVLNTVNTKNESVKYLNVVCDFLKNVRMQLSIICGKIPID